MGEIEDIIMTETEKEINYLDRCVDQFADEMRAKLYKKAHAGYRGWDNPDIVSDGWLEGMIIDHIKSWLVWRQGNQEIDIANLVMFLWVRRMIRETSETKKEAGDGRL